MVIKRSSRKDITVTTSEELEALLIERVPRFKRLTDSVNKRLINLNFDSSKEFNAYLKQIFPRNFPDRYVALGFSKEEIEKEGNRIKKTAEKSAKTNKLRYGKSISSFTIDFWIRRGLTRRQAREKISEIQRKNSLKVSKESRITALPSRTEHWIHKGFSEDEAKKKVAEHQRIASRRCVEHWIHKGFSEDEAKKKVAEHQRSASQEYHKNVDVENFRKNNHWCKEYYENRGFSEEDFYKSKETFSLRKCVERHGEKVGFLVWEDRQKLWLNTLRNKSTSELSEIKRAKSSRTLNGDSGYLYLIQVNDHVVKIGITKHSKLHKRYSLKVYDKFYETFYAKNYLNAFIIEQEILYSFKDNIWHCDYGDFGWTECINDVSFGDIKNLINKKINEYN